MASTIRMVDAVGEVHEHTLEPGRECPACERPLPREKSDDATGAASRERITIGVPPGEEGVLDSLMIGVVEKYKDEWPRDHAAMRAGLGVELVGGRRWRYYTCHFALYATLNVPGLSPTEIGQ